MFPVCSSLAHKCHLCPRSFEGLKGLEKHLQAHKMNRYVEPKVIANADGSITMALSEEPCDVTRRKDSLEGSSGLDDMSQDGATSLLKAISQEDVTSLETKYDITSQDDDQNTISLSVDDLMQYAQPMPVHLIQVILIYRQDLNNCPQKQLFAIRILA